MKFIPIIIAFFFISCTSISKFMETPDISKIHFIHDAQGRIVVYHGMNESNYSKTSTNNQPWQDERDVQWMSNKGFNLSRYLVFMGAINPKPNIFDTAYLRMSIENVKLRGKYGIDVLVDVHQDLFSSKFSGDGFPEWMIRDGGFRFGGPTKPWNLAYMDEAVLASFTNFWNNDTLLNAYVSMLERVFMAFDTLPNVVGIDVMNEPFPGLVCKFEEKTLTKFYKRIYQMRNDNHFAKLMFYEPWMSTSAGLPSKLKFKPYLGGAVYAPHYYDMLVDAQRPYGKVNHELMKRAVAIKMMESIEFGSPIIYGEFGATAGYNAYIGDFVSEMDRYGAGWVYWSYDLDKDNDYGVLNNDRSEKPVVNTLVRIYPQRIAGSAPTFGYKGNTFVLSYKRSDCQEPTTIFIPPGLQYTVETAGVWSVVGTRLSYNNTNDAVQHITIRF